MGGIHVVRSFPFNPPVEGFDYWFNANDPDTLTVASNKVAQWSDLGPNGWDMTQTVDANRVKSGLNTLNGRNLVECDANNQWILKTGLSTNTQGTFFFAFQCSGSFEGPMWLVQNSGRTKFIDIAPKTTNNDLYTFDATNFIGGGAGSWNDLSFRPYICTVKANGGSSALYRNDTGTWTGTIDNNSCDRFGFPDVVTGGSMRVRMGEVIHYPAILGDTDRVAVRDWLNARWAIF